MTMTDETPADPQPESATSVPTSSEQVPQQPKTTSEFEYEGVLYRVRMPNQIQHSEIRDKALAAKARRIRQLKDPESDASAIVEMEMEELLEVGDREALIDELVQKDWYKDHLEAVAEVREREGYEHIDDDEKRLADLREKSPEDRDREEFDELQRHVAKFYEDVKAAREERAKPRRDNFAEKSHEELVGLVRSERIRAEADAHFNIAFSTWEWLYGTFLEDGSRAFPDLDALRQADSGLLARIAEEFTSMEMSWPRMGGNA